MSKMKKKYMVLLSLYWEHSWQMKRSLFCTQEVSFLTAEPPSSPCISRLFPTPSPNHSIIFHVNKSKGHCSAFTTWPRVIILHGWPSLSWSRTVYLYTVFDTILPIQSQYGHTRFTETGASFFLLCYFETGPKYCGYGEMGLCSKDAFLRENLFSSKANP